MAFLIYFCVKLSVYLSICLSVCLSVSFLSVYFYHKTYGHKHNCHLSFVLLLQALNY